MQRPACSSDDDKSVQKAWFVCACPADSLRIECSVTHSRVIRPFIPRLLQKLIGCLSTRLKQLLINMMNGTKALILLGHLVPAVWITRSLAGTMAAVFASPPG